MQKISYTGILFGFISSLVFLVISSLGMGFVFKTIQRTRLIDVLNFQTAILTYTLLSLMISGILGGYIATLISKNSSLKNAIIIGLAIFLYNSLGILTNLDTNDTHLYPAGVTIVSYLIVIPSALFGGYIQSRKQKKQFSE